jgi:phosphatidylinositol-3-phosphatase
MIEALEPRRMMTWLPRPDHIVVVIEENRDYADLFATTAAHDVPYIRSLARYGTSFTKAHSVADGSLANYLALFSGSDQGLGGDPDPAQEFSEPSLAGTLRGKGLSFAGYAEDLPRAGFTGNQSGNYVRRHNPWVDFDDVPASANRPFSSFPTDFSRLPTVAFVVPNVVHDMEEGSRRAGDDWLRTHLGAYAAWAPTHNSLLIITFDEGRTGTRIPTVFYGANVRHHHDKEHTNAYKVLRTIEDMYGLAPLGNSADNGPVRFAFIAPAASAAPLQIQSLAPDLLSDRRQELI